MNTDNTIPVGQLGECLQRVKDHISQCDFNAAAPEAVATVKQFPESAEAWYQLSVVSLQLGRLNLAVDSVISAIKVQPDSFVTLIHAARCFQAVNRWRDAAKVLQMAEQTINIHSASAEEFCELGLQLYKLGKLETALEWFNKSLAKKDGYHLALFNKAATLGQLGQLEQAKQVYEQLLNHYPDDFQACYNLAQLQNHNAVSTLLARISQCLQLQANNLEGRYFCHYALAKVYEDEQHYDLAFRHLQMGAREKRQQSDYCLETEIELLSQAPLAFAPGGHLHLYQPKGLSDDANEIPAPIFIIGLPRTGTTLIERIVASHSKVISGGELTCLPKILMEAAGVSPLSDPFKLTTQVLNSISEDQLHKIGMKYLQQAWARLQVANEGLWGDKSLQQSGDVPTYFIDKLPFNARFVGFIAKAIPQAKIIVVDRDPMDSAFSNYKMLFNHGYDYSYDQIELAEFIVAHKEMMDQWRYLFSDKLMTVSYEDVVADQETEIHRLLNYLQLDYDPNCMSFYKNAQPSLTASASQVRQPIYATSIKRWRSYENQLQPLVIRFRNLGLLDEQVV